MAVWLDQIMFEYPFQPNPFYYSMSLVSLTANEYKVKPINCLHYGREVCQMQETES